MLTLVKVKSFVCKFQMTYAVVLFTAYDEVAVVCQSWLTDSGGVLWPNVHSGTKIKAMLLAQEKPTVNWTCHAARVLSKNIGEFQSDIRSTGYIDLSKF